MTREPSPDRTLRLRALLWRARRPAAAVCAAVAVALVLEAGSDVARPAQSDGSASAPAAPAAAPSGMPVQGGAVNAGAANDEAASDEAASDEAASGVARAPAEDGAPAGTVLVPVRFADSGVPALLTAGTLVDVVAATGSDGGEPRVLARAATVLPAPAASRDGADGGLLGFDGELAVPVLLAMTPDEALQVSAAGTRTPLVPVIVR